jgi:DNA helicase II / ATP-dependent DNA helicase PcrA
MCAERRYQIRRGPHSPSELQAQTPEVVSSVAYRIDYAGLLNDEQFTAVTAPRGPLLVIAGAGSGKTRTVTFRVTRFIEEGLAPQQILLLTFTNRAAREMMGRVAELLPGPAQTTTAASLLWGGTFHHVAHRILRRHAEALGYESNFVILDEDDSKEVMATAIADAGVAGTTTRFPDKGVITHLVSRAINTQTPVVHLIEHDFPQFLDRADEIAGVARAFVERKRQMNAMDFDDLLLNWKVLLTEHDAIAEAVRGQFRALLVDEYQDTNKLQGDIIDLMAQRHRNLTVVGDDAQSIYAFRGAHYDNILKFTDRYPDAKVVPLTVNYRSTPEILTLANRVIAFNIRQHKKTLRARRSAGELPALVPCRDVDQQAAFVAERILELREDGVPLTDMAVLYRAHTHALELQLELSRRKIPYIVRSGIRFFEQAHIKDVLSFLRIVFNPADELSFKRAVQLAPGIGAKSAERLWALVKGPDFHRHLKAPEVEAKLRGAALAGWRSCADIFIDISHPRLRETPGEMLRRVCEPFYREFLFARFPNPSERLDDIEHLIDFAQKFNALDDFLGELMLVQRLGAEDSVLTDEPDEYLTLSSIHQAKGLEWRAVFILWCADGRIPSARALTEPGGEEEERRLFYVATTRAKDYLTMTYPQTWQGRDYEVLILSPSRFLDEVAMLDDDEKHGGPAYERWILEETEELPMAYDQLLGLGSGAQPGPGALPEPGEEG